MSSRERVRLSGVISGQGREAKCTVLATKVTLKLGGPIAYAGYSVESATKVLPEGNYQLAVSNGQVIPIRQQAGNWLARGLY